MNLTAEQLRLQERPDNKGWKKWGPYLSERQWSTVREDYSVYGETWEYFPHDIARSRAYRWGEDGIGGISDHKQFAALAFSFWNHNDPIIKERLFGLTGNEGNNGEDVKELYYYLDSTPTHSYMKMLYKYPIKEFPYNELVSEAKNRGRDDGEYELLDTGLFDNDEYFDIYIEYAKANEDDILVKVHIHNRSNHETKIDCMPTFWFRNVWSSGYEEFQEKPYMMEDLDKNSANGYHPNLGPLHLYFNSAERLLFCENETNTERVFGHSKGTRFPKDAINDYVVAVKKSCINPKGIGTKVAGLHKLTIPAKGSEVVTLRLSKDRLDHPFSDFEQIFTDRKNEANSFFSYVQSDIQSLEERDIQRQAFAGMMWNKQFYYYNVEQWTEGDPIMPFQFNGRSFTKNHTWRHAYMANILSMPDKWEYPWFAAWDLAFHTLTLARIDADFAKRQLAVVLREYYMHPNGQIPAYEWNFSDVNPPVHAWATWKVYEIEKKATGKGDLVFLERIFHKLLMNFTWWVNQKDDEGNNIFGGGFLGLDNIGVFDRSAHLPGMSLKQADATGWMAIYTLNMLRIACEIAVERPAYQDMASKFFEHFLHIAKAINSDIDEDDVGLWDKDDAFFYDKVHTPTGPLFLKVRSLVGLIPLCAVEVLDDDLLEKLPSFRKRLEWIVANRPDLADMISRWNEKGKGQTHLFSLLRGKRMGDVLKRLFSETEFLSDYGIRSLSKYHKENPFTFNLYGENLTVRYSPAESETAIMGGNSNWRGPIWFPLNYLIVDALHKFDSYYGEDFEMEYPSGSGNMMTLGEAANEISKRLISIFKQDEEGLRPALRSHNIFKDNPEFKNHQLFYEYFNGDDGSGLGAAHQTGWTGLVADLILETNRFKKRD